MFQSQKGFSQILLLAIILIGLGVGLYLVQQQTKLKSQASVVADENSISMVGSIDPTDLSEVPKLEPSVYVYPDKTFVVDLLVKTDTDPLNLVSARLKFPADILQVESVEKADKSVVKSWVENNFDNTTGEINLTGGIPNPGFKNEPKQAGLFSRIIFKAKPATAGKSVKLEFQEEGTALYSNVTSQAIPQVIKRSLRVDIVDKVPNSPQPSSSEVSVNYSLDSGDNFIGIPLYVKLTPKELLTLTGDSCQEIWHQSPSGVDTYFADPGKVILNTLTSIEPGKGYFLGKCSKPVQFSLQGEPLKETLPLEPGIQYISLGYAQSVNAEDFLDKVATDKILCREVSRWVAGDWEAHPKDSSINDFKMTQENGYQIKCDSLSDVPAPKPTDEPCPKPASCDGQLVTENPKEGSNCPVYTCKPQTICTQVITPALLPKSFECKDFDDSCLPEGWILLKGVTSCSQAGDLIGDRTFKIGPNFSVMFSKFNNSDGSQPDGWDKADINGDKAINSFDVLILRSVYIGKGLIKP